MFGGLAASGWHTAAITMRLMVDLGVPAGGLIGAGGEIAWPRPTRPGDTLRVVSEVLEVVPSRSRNDRGTVVMRNETRNQRDEIVQLFTAKLIAFLRNVMLSKSNATGNAAAMPQAQLGTISTMRSMSVIVDTAALAFCVPVLSGTAGFRVGSDASLAQAAAYGSTVACTISGLGGCAVDIADAGSVGTVTGIGDGESVTTTGIGASVCCWNGGGGGACGSDCWPCIRAGRGGNGC